MNAKIAAEEAAEEQKNRSAEEAAAIKKAKQQAKVDAQKAAGTYMTKGEKAKAKANADRLEAMKDAGMVVGTGEKKDGAGASKIVYDSKKKKNNNTPQARAEEERIKREALAVEQKKRDEEAAITAAAAEQVEVEVADDWDNSDDDWDAALDDLTAKVEEFEIENCEDELELEAKKEQDNLKKLGLERAKREEEAKAKRDAEEYLRCEMEREEMEAFLKKEASRKRRTERDDEARAAATTDRLRSPISVIMGHVDTGKTKLLDKIRHTNVQEGEAGGITQQIGATMFPRETLIEQTKSMQSFSPLEIRLPGLLMIDTPGHESFSNLRSRGSSLCDVAILVVDLMHGLEPQTIESINILKKGKVPFVIALNKIDRLYGWKSTSDNPIKLSLDDQDDNTMGEFKDRCQQCSLQLNEQGLNVKLYWENDSPEDTVSIVPTSAHTGEGVPDLLQMVIKLTQEMQTKKLAWMNVLQCTVLEVKVIDGLGATCDVVLVNGTLKEGDTIVVSTMDGPVTTTIRSLLTPPPNKEMRVKSEYLHHKKLEGAIGIKIVAQDIGRAIAGTPVLVIHPEDDPDDVREDVQSDLATLTKALETDSKGVMVHASTLGALEALLQFLRNECKPPIPVSHFAIGKIFKKDVMRANLNHANGTPEYATILAFDVGVDPTAQEMADKENVRIFTADIIYHLFDQFSAYMRGITEERKREAEEVVQFPCILKIFPQHVFNKRDPIVVGVEVLEGQVRLGTTLCIPSLDNLVIGNVTNIQLNHKDVTVAKKGLQISVKITNDNNPTISYGRQFDHNNSLYSKLSRNSIDALKEHFKEDMTKDDWALVIKLKKTFEIK